MHIEFIEVRNFRKLKSVRIDLTSKTTLLVGANNSGKTSAMTAFKRFLLETGEFIVTDFTLSNWSSINAIGTRWTSEELTPELLAESSIVLMELMPSLDIWLKVANSEIHYVSHLLPTLDWEGGLIGARFRLEPKKIEDLYAEYVKSYRAAKDTLVAANLPGDDQAGAKTAFGLWPESLGDFLGRKLKTYFSVQTYSLDPSRIRVPVNGVASIQNLPSASEPLDGNPLKGLIRIDLVDAQRGFSDLKKEFSADDDEGTQIPRSSSQRKLSDQLRSYYRKHLDPSDTPEPSDVEALFAIKKAQDLFDDKLDVSFSAAISEVQNLGYPGVTDPTLRLSTKIRPVDGLNHAAAVQYSVIQNNPAETVAQLLLPEETNGLGYQNLISMIFRLMSFRDEWMCVGKANKKLEKSTEDGVSYPPIHLVLLEEPEAHLHIQVQQVFMQKAYDVLRKHDELGEKKAFTTQLVVSTHSSHVAHECEFSTLRYFRRKPAAQAGEVPVSSVINLSEVFEADGKTERFVKRYLKTSHCDLFFADAAILVEGPAERMLVPHFIRGHYADLSKCYITLLEIGGSHAHRFRGLIEHLGLTTLIITDLDAATLNANKRLASSQPKRAAGMVSGNSTLRTWLPEEKSIDALLNCTAEQKIKKYDDHFSIRVAFQAPLMIVLKEGEAPQEEALSNTFEDALVFSNIPLFRTVSGTGLIKTMRKAVNESADAVSAADAMFQALDKGDKAAFALDLFYLPQHPLSLLPPVYISEGLTWLEIQMQRKRLESINIENSSVIIDPVSLGAQ